MAADSAMGLKYPRSVAFIISNEFCERFNYYGMRTILVLYLQSKLHYDKDTSTVLFHVFTMLVYLCPIAGAVIADSWLGKFKTILNLSIVYAIGGIIVALGAIPTLHLPVKEATIVGLVLIALGTGGIKPCVSAFGGDQFTLPQQAKQLAQFFSMFYFAINAGSMISTSVTPILREDVYCFGDKDCYSLAFGVPALLMLLSVVIFVAGKKLYVTKPPAGNMIFCVTQCIMEALSRWRKERKTDPKKHWLDYAESTCGKEMVRDTKILLKILVLYLPFPVFWALFDQQGSRWTFQATRMNGDIMGFVIKPDQMQVINPLLILGFIPLFDYVLYPLLSKIGIRRPLQKLTMGGSLAAIAFLISAFVELHLEGTEPAVPTQSTGQLRIYNGMPCTFQLQSNLPASENDVGKAIEALGLWEAKNIMVAKPQKYDLRATSSDSKCSPISTTLEVAPNKANSYFITNDGIHKFEDKPEKPELGHPLLRVLLNVPVEEDNIILVDSSGMETDLSKESYKDTLVRVPRGPIKLCINNTCDKQYDIETGGVYALSINGNSKDGYNFSQHIITTPNTLHMLWQLPQIIVITAAEIMFSVTGLEFSFTQAPQSMKSVLQACWLLSVAIGNMLVVVVAELKFFESQAAEFLLFATLMLVDMFIFMFLAGRYKYVEHHDNTKGHIENGKRKKQNDEEFAEKGVQNNAYEHS